MCRHHFKTIPNELETFLEVLDPKDSDDLKEGYKLLKIWKWPITE